MVSDIRKNQGDYKYDKTYSVNKISQREHAKPSDLAFRHGDSTD